MMAWTECHAILKRRRTSPACKGIQSVFMVIVFSYHNVFCCRFSFLHSNLYAGNPLSSCRPFPLAERNGVFFFGEDCGMAGAASLPPRNGQAAHGPHATSRASSSPRLSFPCTRARVRPKGFRPPEGVPFFPCTEGIAPRPCLCAVNLPPIQMRRRPFFRMRRFRIKKQTFIMDCIAFAIGKKKLQCVFSK